MSATKEQIRRTTLRRTQERDLADRQRAGVRIARQCEILLRHVFKPDLLMCYVSRRDEAPTHDIIRGCLARGQKVCVPWVAEETGAIRAGRLKNFTTDLAPGHAGILEPRDTCRRPVEPRDISLHFVPGMAYDPNGARLGRGSGHYDRFLADCAPETVKIGLAFSWQIVESIPTEAHDVGMDLVLTEEGCIEIRRDLLNDMRSES
jgi:5-formyltetrahydrofolate cyclo-ligase